MQFWQVAAAALVVASLVVAPFLVRPTTGEAAAVPMENTRSVGAPEYVVRAAQDSSLVLPQAEVYYSQFRYVVGYHGIAPFLAGLRADVEREMGAPLAVYVSDFSGTGVYVGSDGLLRMPESRATDWIRARDAYFVVESRAGLLHRESAVVPFSRRSDAAAFAEQYGGRVVRWQTVRDLDVGAARRSASEWRNVTAARRERANRTVADARHLLDRPVSVTVAPNESLAAAVRRAPANTTVLLEAGNHSVSDVRVEKPVTIRGAGANRTRLVGDGNRSVLYVNASRVAVADLTITGVGPVRSRDPAPARVPVPRESFRYDFWATHGYGDAGIVFDTSRGSLVSGVRIVTDANGVIARNSPGLVVSKFTLRGSKRWQDGFLGVVVLGAPAVVQDATFLGGKVGVFAHDTQSFTVRDSTMRGMMIGVFSVYAQGAFVANTTIEDTYVGVYVHDRSRRNVVVNSTVTNSQNGVLIYGRSSYVAGNVLVHNQYGFVIQGQYSLYRGNVAAFNQIGVRAMSLFPTNRVRGNDFVANHRYAATARFNVLHVWRGNYWQYAPGIDSDGDGYLARDFRATSSIAAVADAQGAPTLARSPSLKLLRRLQQTLAGLRFGGVVDERPRATPAHPELVARLLARYDDAGRFEDQDDWDYEG